MEGITIRHWIETPVRHQDIFQRRDLEDCALENLLYALPGRQCAPLDRHVKVEGNKDPECKSRSEDTAPFPILLDLVQFKPEDIIIQIFEGWLIIKAEHGCRMDEHGFVSRSVTRTYKLPSGIQSKDLSAIFCHDGILAVCMHQ
ncbi:heat shock protein beta-3 [Pseudophryne corroboree]|uniref:heat shock protein beta-3 n=1 Tax=Pseudophryne corroboree TaxID=495146 RepID=UPI0030814E6E